LGEVRSEASISGSALLPEDAGVNGHGLEDALDLLHDPRRRGPLDGCWASAKEFHAAFFQVVAGDVAALDALLPVRITPLQRAFGVDLEHAQEILSSPKGSCMWIEEIIIVDNLPRLLDDLQQRPVIWLPCKDGAEEDGALLEDGLDDCLELGLVLAALKS